jgi:hypothetical protein
MKYILIATILLMSCKKDNQIINMTFDGSVNSCKPSSTKKAKAHLTIYDYNKSKHEGNVNIRIEGISTEFVGHLVKPENGEQYQFKGVNDELGSIKDKQLNLMYRFTDCFYVFKGEKR